MEKLRFFENEYHRPIVEQAGGESLRTGTPATILNPDSNTTNPGKENDLCSNPITVELKDRPSHTQRDCVFGCGGICEHHGPGAKYWRPVQRVITNTDGRTMKMGGRVILFVIWVQEGRGSWDGRGSLSWKQHKLGRQTWQRYLGILMIWCLQSSNCALCGTTLSRLELIWIQEPE